MFSNCCRVRGGCIPAFTVPVSVDNVEVRIVVGIEAVHHAKLGEPPKDLWVSLELEEGFARFSIGRQVGRVPEGRVLDLRLVFFSPTPENESQ